MTKRMTAEEVAGELAKQARWHAEFRASADANAFREAAQLVRENLIESDDQRRERFERWCDREGILTATQLNGSYVQPIARTMWHAWQAALTYRDSEES